ncbi:executer 1 [Ancistrocladus abbreviatus]
MASSIHPPPPRSFGANIQSRNIYFRNSIFIAHLQSPQSISFSLSRAPDYTRCYCHGQSSDSLSSSDSWGWETPLHQFIRSAFQKIDAFVKSRLSQSKADATGMLVGERGDEVEERREEDDDDDDDRDWDWDSWMKHFKEVEEEERLISVLKSQLGLAIDKEDYEDAARLKVAIAAVATKDTVGCVMSYLNRAIEEERYQDAAFMRDNAGVGLVGWWAGVSDDRSDPYGCIVRINAEHGRYVARSYSARQLATSTAGSPLFEIFLTLNKKGQYKQQAVYLKRKVVSQKVFPRSSAATSNINTLNPSGGKTDLPDPSSEEIEDGDDGDDSDLADGISGFQNILQDMIPGLKVKVLKVTTPEKVDQDIISKVIEQIMEEDDEDKEPELDSVDMEGRGDGESGEEKYETGMDAGNGITDREDQGEVAVKVVIGGLLQKPFSSAAAKDLLRVPAKLEKKGRKSFSFTIENDKKQQDSSSKGRVPSKRKANGRDERSADHVVFDLAKFVSRGEKIPIKVLKDVGEMIRLSLSQAQSRQPLIGSTTFNRIELPSFPDPLNGLYIGSHGPYTSEVIQLRRRFGQWQVDSGTKGPSNLEFYEYVEAVKLTGDPYVPAGQVAFRAKVGRRYQLPHKGIIPEEFGVIARYKGQGRLAEPGYQNPRWVDGELVILDGKYIKAGPVVGFVYWAPEYQFLVFFSRLRIQE